jgi:5-methyltetrahydrofolate--homocysteine methyltransferase
MTVIDELREAIVEGQVKIAVAKVDQGLVDGIEAGTLLREGLIAGMAQVGKLYEEGEIFVPEMLVAARAMTAALGVLKPHLVEQGVASAGKVAMSALLTTTMTNMQATIDAIGEAGLRQQARIIIGGAPITKTYADEIGADGYAVDASSAVRLAREVLAA